MFDPRVSIYIDPANPQAPSGTFDNEGLPVKKLPIIEKGVVKNLYYSRYWAQKQKTEPTGFTGNFLMEGGTQSLEDLIKSTQKGILVTRLWYIRDVDPQTLLVTGLTHRESYKDVGVITVIIPLAGVITIGVLGTLFGAF